jgi:hypothetical protein
LSARRKVAKVLAYIGIGCLAVIMIVAIWNRVHPRPAAFIGASGRAMYTVNVTNGMPLPIAVVDQSKTCAGLPEVRLVDPNASATLHCYSVAIVLHNAGRRGKPFCRFVIDERGSHEELMSAITCAINDEDRNVDVVLKQTP